MSIIMLDPTGKVASSRGEPERPLEVIAGRRVGYVFNGHASGRVFWKALEDEVEKSYRPSAASRVHKVNTWAPAPHADMQRLLAESDYVLVGLGA
jgi:hypothetical protein